MMIEFLENNPQVVVTLIIGVFTLIISYWYNRNNLIINHQKMEKELFSEYNKKYDNLNDSLSLLSVSMTIEELKSTPSKIENKMLYHVVIDYFNLCAEQFYWNSKDRISKEIWNAWNAGMMNYYDTYPVIRELWEVETKGNGFKSFYLSQSQTIFKKR